MTYLRINLRLELMIYLNLNYCNSCWDQILCEEALFLGVHDFSFWQLTFQTYRYLARVDAYKTYFYLFQYLWFSNLNLELFYSPPSRSLEPFWFFIFTPRFFYFYQEIIQKNVLDPLFCKNLFHKNYMFFYLNCLKFSKS